MVNSFTVTVWLLFHVIEEIEIEETVTLYFLSIYLSIHPAAAEKNWSRPPLPRWIDVVRSTDLHENIST